jgi:DNA-binding response OmpR family regulator
VNKRQRDTVLILEQDAEIADLLAANLEDAGLVIERAPDGRTGLRKALAGDPSLVILDAALPAMDWLSVCARIRERNRSVPILLLTAGSEESDRISCFEGGADDCLAKPFSARELAARVKALLRRGRACRETMGLLEADGKIGLGGIVLDPDTREVTRDGNPVALTVKEFDLLALFLRNPGRAFSRTDLLNNVWGLQFGGFEHTVNSHLNRLRGKIERDPAHPRYLKTVWGIGYRFASAMELQP